MDELATGLQAVAVCIVLFLLLPIFLPLFILIAAASSIFITFITVYVLVKQYKEYKIDQSNK